MAFDPSEYCKTCGEPGACGCPADLSTQDKMICPHCNGQWWRQWGDSSTWCLHPSCRKEGSVVKTPAAYAPRYDEKGCEVGCSD